MMIDLARDVRCPVCGKPMKQAPDGHRLRGYDDGVCKMRHRRRRQAEKQAHHADAAYQQDIAALQGKLIAAGECILKLERRVRAAAVSQPRS